MHGFSASGELQVKGGEWGEERAARELNPANQKKSVHPDIQQLSWDSLVVTHPTTNQPACSLSTTDQTGSPVFCTLWPYVEEEC